MTPPLEPTADWTTDVLGAPYERRSLELFPDLDGPQYATLVRRLARPGNTRAVLHVHGFADYFFQTAYADWWIERGYDFYAVDLRRYGRSLAEGQYANYTDDLGMFVRKRIDGLHSDTGYRVELELELASNVGDDCFGIGGSPGSDVFLHMGASTTAPTCGPTRSGSTRIVSSAMPTSAGTSGCRSVPVRAPASASTSRCWSRWPRLPNWCVTSSSWRRPDRPIRCRSGRGSRSSRLSPCSPR